jgi:sigma-E factor negative regulatory protein RseC
MAEDLEGIVIAREGALARVKASRHSDCDNCGACPGDSAMVLDVSNPLDAAVGQKVLLAIPEAGMLKAAFIVYVMPLLSSAFGAVGGGLIAERFSADMSTSGQVVGGVLFFILSLFVVFRYDRRSKKKASMLPVIVKILGQQSPK